MKDFLNFPVFMGKPMEMSLNKVSSDALSQSTTSAPSLDANHEPYSKIQIKQIPSLEVLLKSNITIGLQNGQLQGAHHRLLLQEGVVLC